jgi:cephalosporin hydroxylase
MCDAILVTIDPRRSQRRVIGVDIDIRAHNRAAISPTRWAATSRCCRARLRPSRGAVHAAAAGFKRVLVLLDSMHTHDHVLAELEAYAPLVTPGSYCVVFDTFVQDMPPHFFEDRPWDVGNNPKTALRQWLGTHPEFEIDASWQNKLMVTVAPEGFLRRKG